MSNSLSSVDRPVAGYIDVSETAFRNEPYARFREARELFPVCKVMPYSQGGYTQWAVCRYDDVLAVLRNPKVFSSDLGRFDAELPPELHEFYQSRSLLMMDPPDHTRLRRILARAFTLRNVGGMEGFVEDLCRELMTDNDAFDGASNFVAGFAERLPVAVIAELLGVGADRWTDMKTWTEELMNASELQFLPPGPARTERIAFSKRCHQEAWEFFSDLITARRVDRREDLISLMLDADDAGNSFTDEEINLTAQLLLIAGFETTKSLLGHALRFLAEHPDVYTQLQGDRELIPAFVEEMLRLDGPVLGTSRMVREDTELGGVQLKAGDGMLVMISSANHDETTFPEPEVMKLDRPNAAKHLAFGHGVHLCIGASLSRLEMRVALNAVFDRYAGIEVQGTPVHRQNAFLRGYEDIRLSFSPIAHT